MLQDSKPTHRRVRGRGRRADFIKAMNDCDRADAAPPQGPPRMDIRTPHFSRKRPFRPFSASSPPPSPTGQDRLALPTSFADAVGVCLAIPQRNCGRISRPSPVPGRWKEHERGKPILPPVPEQWQTQGTRRPTPLSCITASSTVFNIIIDVVFSSYHPIQIR